MAEENTEEDAATKALMQRLFEEAKTIRERLGIPNIGKVPVEAGFLLWSPIITALLNKIEALECRKPLSKGDTNDNGLRISATTDGTSNHTQRG